MKRTDIDPSIRSAFMREQNILHYGEGRLTRFMLRMEINPKGCWQWVGPKNRGGYGQIRFWKRTRWVAHRLAYHLAIGPIPAGIWILHRCDNPACCNPAHLFTGTNLENVSDKVLKGRQASGESCNKKLTSQDVREIRALHAAGQSLSQIVTRFGTTKTNISQVIRRKTWKHLPD